MLWPLAGCQPVTPQPVELPKAEPLKPLKIEQPKVEPDEVALSEVEPNEVEPNEIEPDEVGLGEIEPNEVEPKQIEPNEVELGEVEPNEIKPVPIVSVVTHPRSVPPSGVLRKESLGLRTDGTTDFHDKCAGILGQFVDDKGKVNYKMLKRKRPELRGLLDEFAALEPSQYNSWPKKDKIAFWINVYNIQMLNIIVSNYPIQSLRIMRLFWPPTSIRHIEGIWSKYKFIVMDEEFTLSEIEQRLFRKEFTEPKVFFAISYASVSGPALRNEPYYGRKLSRQLDEQVKEFLSSPRAFKIDRKKQKVYLSAILKSTWYGRQFISGYGTDKKFKDKEPAVRAVLNFATNYIPRQDVSFLETGNYTVEYIAYDWRLNE
jgi:hypothetical protein